MKGKLTKRILCMVLIWAMSLGTLSGQAVSHAEEGMPEETTIVMESGEPIAAQEMTKTESSAESLAETDFAEGDGALSPDTCRELFDTIDPQVKDFFWGLYESELRKGLSEEAYHELLDYVKEGASQWLPDAYQTEKPDRDWQSWQTNLSDLPMGEDSLSARATGAYQAESGMVTLGHNVNLATLGRNGKDVWKLTLDGETSFCLDMTLKAHSGHTYTQSGTTSDEVIRKAIAYYELTNPTNEGYEFAQMYIWSGGIQDVFVRTMFEYALSRFNPGLYTPEKLLGMGVMEMNLALNALDAGYASALGMAYNAIRNQNTGALSDVYVFTGPAGYQRFATLYQGVWNELGEPPEPTEPPEPEYPEPEYDSVTASAEVTAFYQAEIDKKDEHTNQGLSGVVFIVYRDDVKVGEVTTNAEGYAVYRDSDTFEARSGEKVYCTNFDEIDPDLQESLDCYRSEQEARAAAQAEADAMASSQASGAKHTYRFAEKQAKEGYYNNPSRNQVSVTVPANGSASAQLTNERVYGSIRLKKEDLEAEENTSHGTASLEGAIYDLYVGKNNILHPDGKSGVAVYHTTIYEDGRVEKDVELTAGTLAGSAEIRNGELIFENLYLGDYIIRERVKDTIEIVSRDLYGAASIETRRLSYAKGYLCDEEDHPVRLIWNGQQYREEIVSYPGDHREDPEDSYVEFLETAISREQIIKSAFRLAKLGAGSGQTETDTPEGVGFSVFRIDWLSKVDEFTKKADGSYDIASILAAYINENYTDQSAKYDFSGESQAAAILYAEKEEAEAYNESLRQGLNGTGKGLIPTGAENQYRLSELFTNAAGILQSPLLPYGQYLVAETTPLGEYFVVDPFIVTVEEQSPAINHQEIRYLLDEEFEAYLKVTKKDADTGLAVRKPGASFRIYDLQNECYIRQTVAGSGSLEKSEIFTATAEGILLLTERLPVGEYRLEEVTAPEGFHNEWETEKNGCVEFAVSTGRAYQATGEKTSEGRDMIVIEETYENEEARGFLTIRKEGEKLDGYENGQFTYETCPLAGAVFEVRAAEDIVTQDNQTDGEGNPHLWYEKGQLVVTVVTGEDGAPEQIIPSDENPITQIIESGTEGEISFMVPPGKYTVTEVTAPYGYVRDKEPVTVEFIWNGQTEKIVYNSYEESASGDGSIRFTDIRVKPEQKEDSGILGVGVKKKNGETQEAVAGAVFGLYTKDAVYCTDGTMLLEAGSLLAVSEPTDAEGFTGFSVDVPLRDESWSEGAACNSGRYVIREQQSPEGYLLNPQETEVVFLYEDPEPEWVFVSGECENIESEFVVSKREIAGSEELSGCTLQILEVTGVDEEGKYMAEQILSWESTDTPEVIRGLKLGEEVIDGEVKPLYILRELRPADGYVTAEDIFFYLKQEEDKETGELLPATIVYQLKEDGNGNQIGEIVTDGILVMEDDFTKGLISKTDLATGEPVVGAELMITDAEGNVAAQWITTKEPYYIEKLVPGDYVLTERKTPEGSDYSVAESMAFRVEDSGEIWHIEMQDDHIRFLIGKTDKDTGKNVAGARLRLEYLPGVTEEETGKNTPVVICEFVSEEKDRLFEHVLPGVYRLTELEAPEGYRLAEPILFTVTNDWQTQRFVLENERKPREVPPIPEETPPKQTEGEETGDINAVIFDVTLAAIALAALILTVETRVLKWHRKERQE